MLGMRYITIRIPRITHRKLTQIAHEEQRTLYGVVDIALTYYDEFRKQAEEVIDDMELRPRRRT